MAAPGIEPLATLRLFADDLSPEIVADALHEAPDAAAVKGANLYPGATNAPVAAKTGTWLISTKHRGLEAGPAQHLAWVVDLVDSRLDALRLRIPGLKADLSLLVHQADFEISDLPAHLLERAVRIGDLEVEVPDRNLDVVLTSKNWRDVAATAKRPPRPPGGAPG